MRKRQIVIITVNDEFWNWNAGSGDDVVMAVVDVQESGEVYCEGQVLALSLNESLTDQRYLFILY